MPKLKPRPAIPAPPRPTSSTVQDFCWRHQINPSTFYRRRDTMPATIKIGGSVRITEQAEREWLEQAQGRAAA